VGPPRALRGTLSAALELRAELNRDPREVPAPEGAAWGGVLRWRASRHCY